MSPKYILTQFNQRFPNWTIDRWKVRSADTLQIWTGPWVFIFTYKTPDHWSLITLHGWEEEHNAASKTKR